MGRFFSSPLSRAFALMVIAASTMLTVVITAFQLWFDYSHSVAAAHNAHKEIEISYQDSLATSLWTFDSDQVQSQLGGIANLNEIEVATIISEQGTQWTAGSEQSHYTLTKEIPLIYTAKGRVHQLGRLILGTSLDNIYWSLFNKFSIILF